MGALNMVASFGSRCAANHEAADRGFEAKQLPLHGCPQAHHHWHAIIDRVHSRDAATSRYSRRGTRSSARTWTRYCCGIPWTRRSASCLALLPASLSLRIVHWARRGRTNTAFSSHGLLVDPKVGPSPCAGQFAHDRACRHVDLHERPPRPAGGHGQVSSQMRHQTPAILITHVQGRNLSVPSVFRSHVIRQYILTHHAAVQTRVYPVHAAASTSCTLPRRGSPSSGSGWGASPRATASSGTSAPSRRRSTTRSRPSGATAGAWHAGTTPQRQQVQDHGGTCRPDEIALGVCNLWTTCCHDHVPVHLPSWTKL